MWHYLAVKKTLRYYEKSLQKVMVIIIVLRVIIHLEQKINLNCVEMYVKSWLLSYRNARNVSKYNHKEKSETVPFVIYTNNESQHEKINATAIQKSHQQSILHAFIYYLHIAHLIAINIYIITIEIKSAWKSFVKI